MHGIRRTLLVGAILGALGAVTPADDPGCGTIDTTGAVVEAGAAPTQGTVLLDPCAREEERPAIPDLPDLGTLGTFSEAPGSYVPPPDISPAVPQDFHATAGVVIPAGQHVYAAFAIDPNVTVSVASGAEIWTTGDALIEGKLQFSGAGLFHCGGDLTLDGGDGWAAIHTGGTNGPVHLQVAGSFHSGTRDEVISARLGLHLETFGTPPTSGNVLIEGPFWAIQEDVVVKAGGGIRISGDDAHLEVDHGAARLFAFGGDIELDTYASVLPADSDDAGSTVIEAAGGISLTGGSEIDASNDCPLRMTAFGGDVLIQESVVNAYTEMDDCWVRASGSVVVEGADSYLDLDAIEHAVDVRAFGGAVEFRELENETNFSYLGGRDIRIAAATGVRLERVVVDAYCEADQSQAISVEAHGGSIQADGRFRIFTLDDRPGTATLHATDGIALLGWAEAFVQADGAGGIAMLAGSGGIDLDLPHVESNTGGIHLLGEGPVSIDTDVESRDDVRLVSTRSWVDAPGALVTTEDLADGRPSGDVVIESWAGSAGRVDVSTSTVRTGTSTTTSGDVTIRVVQAGGAVELDSYLLPKTVKTKRGKKDVADSLMTLSGDVDLGTTGPDLTQPTTLRIGDRTFDLPGLTANAKGNKLTHRDDVLDVKVTTDAKGSSKGRFTFKVRGDPADVGDPDGTLVLALACSDMDARCAVALVGGGFKRGKVRGAVIEPPVRLDKAKVVVKGAGKDKLSLKLGLTAGGAPGTAPEVELGIGDSWSVVLPGDRFTPKKETFRFKGDESGIRKVTLDYGKEALSVSGKGLDLGPHIADDGVLRLRVRVGAEELALRVRTRTKGATRSY